MNRVKLWQAVKVANNGEDIPFDFRFKPTTRKEIKLMRLVNIMADIETAIRDKNIDEEYRRGALDCLEFLRYRLRIDLIYKRIFKREPDDDIE